MSSDPITGSDPTGPNDPIVGSDVDDDELDEALDLPPEALAAIAGGEPEQTENGLAQPDAPQDAEPIDGSVTSAR
jgi:hypothetical protein